VKAANINDPAPATDGVRGFSQKVLHYFLDFLQTDFKKQQAPRRRISLKSDAGFRLGMPLRKYQSLYAAVWKFVGAPTQNGLQFKISHGQYRAPINSTLRDLISQRIESIPAKDFEDVGAKTIEYAQAQRAKAAEHPEKFVESVLVQLVEQVGDRIVQPLLSLLEGSFKDSAYSAVESIYDVESDLTDAITARALENLPNAINSLIVSGKSEGMSGVFAEFLAATEARARIQTFFDDFVTSDAFQEVRDLQHALKSTENQSLYLYLCDIKFGANAFPLFYVPAALEYREESREFVLELDPHLLINKQAVDWILQERDTAAANVRVPPIQDRIVYVDGAASFVDAITGVFDKLLPPFDFAADIDVRRGVLQQVSSPTVKISTAAYFAIFDRSDESMVNDYEELLAALGREKAGAASLFENIISGFLNENPASVISGVDRDWEGTKIPERLVADLPIPLNEEQRKILAALAKSQCNYISVQGPPGTGKSHTITAIAFNGILNEESVLILSDKTEALDVVEDKLESVLSKVRQGDDDFPNPILRLGRTGNTFNRLVTQSAKDKVKRHYQAARQHTGRIEKEIVETTSGLRTEIDKTIHALSSIELAEVAALHRLEAEIAAVRPALVPGLQTPQTGADPAAFEAIAKRIDKKAAADLLAKLEKESDCRTLAQIIAALTAWVAAGGVATKHRRSEALSLFAELNADHHATLLRFVAEYENLRMPLFGWLFRKKRVRDVDSRLGAELLCTDPIDLHKRLADLKHVTRVVGALRNEMGEELARTRSGFAYRAIRNGDAAVSGVSDLLEFFKRFSGLIGADGETAVGAAKFKSPAELVSLMQNAARYAADWRRVASQMESVPKTDYVATKGRIEQLYVAKMTNEIDRRFIEFVENKKATVKEIAGVIKGKRKFPESEFQHLADAFPIIIAGIREFADYVPLRERMFDVVVIDEASQVSVAQALPAILRAKKVVVFGDAKQFSNVKSSQASASINAGYLTDIEAYFRANVADAANKMQRLKHFDVKKSVLEFFDIIANYDTMLRKHFRGYQELISFSSKHFYEGQLQAIKIRSKPISEIIRFEIVEPGPQAAVKNTNRKEAEFILQELRRMIDVGEESSVGVITPFREQVKTLNEVIYKDTYADRFDSDLRLKIMTFDSCQGEERDLIVFSMVATVERDVLNYVFPTTLEGLAERAEEALKVQRLNVGFSRAKEGFLFVLSKPVEEFKGSIGRVLNHYKTIVEDRSRPDGSEVDSSSPMEKKVLDWIYKTAFVQLNEEAIEVVPQFPIGRYLKQLDPFYSHPAYRCDFLLRYQSGQAPVNVIIEYDGFAEHFVDRQNVHNGNWDRYYRPEDVERQMIIESYGYKFLRLNRFNLGANPIETLSSRLYELVDVALKSDEEASVVSSIKEDVRSLEDGSKKKCGKCEEIKEIKQFWDRKLKSGHGGYGRVCLACKSTPVSFKPSGSRWRAKQAWRSTAH
jgi:hypothetical protein